jgi:aromatic-L-amino-acid/L-tryptophan decarboxylase
MNDELQQDEMQQDSAQPPGLELDGAAFREMVDAVMERLAPLLDGITTAPAAWPERAAPPSHASFDAGTGLDAVLDDLFGRLPAGINTAAPGFMGYVPGGGIPHAAVADLIASVVNRYVGISLPAPALAALERDVIRWMAGSAGMPATAGGTFTSGGSAANLIGLVAAREAHFPDGGDAGAHVHRGTLYVSDQAHHSVLKAARFAGLRTSQLRVVPTDDAFRMRTDALADAIRDDRRNGRVPFLVVASAGTTNTGAVDPLAEMAGIAADAGAWFHVDAAYGGFFALTERGRALLAGMERADTLVLDPHKTMFLPYGTGALLVREPQRVAALFATAAEYLPQRSADDVVEPAELGFELTRPFRGLRVWLPLRLLGVAPFRRVLDEKLDLARWLDAELRQVDAVEVVASPQLSTLAFAARRRPGEDAGAVNRRSRELLEHVNASRDVLVTGTTVRQRFIVRPSIVSFRTHLRQVETVAERVRSWRG